MPPIAIPTPRFEAAFDYLIGNEGTLETDHPNDHGGLTHYGITRAILGQYLGRTATTADVANIDRPFAQKFYLEMFWLPLRCESIAQPCTSVALFDIAVLCGHGRAVAMAQRAIGVEADGEIGPVTMAGLSACPANKFLQAFVSLVIDRFISIATADPTQMVFLRGWCRRGVRLLSLAPHPQ